MTSNPTKIVIDLSKPKGQRESIIELTAEEIAEHEAMAANAEANRLAEEAIEAQKAVDAQAGRNALLALGLSEAQITALVGA